MAWMLYCCVLFNVFACSIGHGQMVGMQLNGIGGQFVQSTRPPRPPASSNPSEEKLPTLSKAFGCPLCSGGGMGPAFNSSLTLAILPRTTQPAVGAHRQRRPPCPLHLALGQPTSPTSHLSFLPFPFSPLRQRVAFACALFPRQAFRIHR